VDEARRKIQEMVDSGLLPAEQAASMLAHVVERIGRGGMPASVAQGPLLERRTSHITQILIADGVTRIKVVNPLGRLRVSAPSSEGVQVEIAREAAAEPSASFELLMKQFRVEDLREGGTLTIRVLAPETPANIELAASAMVTVPHGLTVDGNAAGGVEIVGLRGDGSWSAEGEVRVADYQGTLDLHDSDGDVSVEHSGGALDLHVENGSVTVSHVRGSLQISCTNGDVHLYEVDGAASISVPQGDLKVHAFRGTLEAHVGTGNAMLLEVFATRLRLSVASGSAWISAVGDDLEAQTREGDLTVLVPGDASAQVYLEGPSLQCDFPLVDATRAEQIVSGRLGDGAGRIRLMTREGRLRLGPGDAL